MAESFVDTLETDLIADRVWRTRLQLGLAIVEYVARVNSMPLHESPIGPGYAPQAQTFTLSSERMSF